MQKHNILYSYSGKYEKGHGSFLPEHILWLMLSGTMEVATHTGISAFGPSDQIQLLDRISEVPLDYPHDSNKTQWEMMLKEKVK